MKHKAQVILLLTFTAEMKRLVNEINAVLSERLRTIGLTGVQAEVQMALERLGPVTLKQLSAHLIAESGHPSRLVSRLVDDGFVTRATSASDGRAVTLELTEKGHEFAALALRARGPLVNAIAQRFGSRLDGVTAFIREFREALAELSGKEAL